MRDDIKAALMKFENKLHAAVQTDAELGRLDYNDDKWVRLERKSKQLWADSNAARKDLTELLETVS
jgi:hypothetical protein